MTTASAKTPADEPRRVVMHSMPVLRTSISLSIVLVFGALLLWYGLGAPIRRLFTATQIATLIFFIMVMVGLMLGVGLSRIVVDANGLTVRNGIRTQLFEWSRIEAVTLGGGDPWAYLQLRPTTEHPEGRSHLMLGIQRAEGEIADEKVQRLNDIVDEHRSSGAAPVD